MSSYEIFWSKLYKRTWIIQLKPLWYKAEIRSYVLYRRLWVLTCHEQQLLKSGEAPFPWELSLHQFPSAWVFSSHPVQVCDMVSELHQEVFHQHSPFVWVPFLESQDTRQYPGHINNAWRMVLNSLTWPSLNMSIMTYQKNWISGSKHFRVWMKWFSHCIFSENWKISVRLLDEKKNIIFVLAFIKISKKKKKKKDNSHSRVLSRVQVCEVPSV